MVGVGSDTAKHDLYTNVRPRRGESPDMGTRVMDYAFCISFGSMLGGILKSEHETWSSYDTLLNSDGLEVVIVGYLGKS